MKHFLLSACIAFSIPAFSQSIQNLENLSPPANLGNIHNQKLFGDSLVSSFVLFIKKEVKLHKHVAHSEHVYILEGEADMQLGNEKKHVRKGDLIFIPKNTPHSVKVTSSVPLKVISIQAPLFDGSDRAALE